VKGTNICPLGKALQGDQNLTQHWYLKSVGLGGSAHEGDQSREEFKLGGLPSLLLSLPKILLLTRRN